MLGKSFFLIVIFIIQVFTINIRYLTDSSDKCLKSAYLDKDGNIRDENCNTCIKVCIKCT